MFEHVLRKDVSAQKTHGSPVVIRANAGLVCGIFALVQGFAQLHKRAELLVRKGHAAKNIQRCMLLVFSVAKTHHPAPTTQLYGTA